MSFPWDAFLTRYGPMARALARPLVRPPAMPEDVVQEAAVALHGALAREPARFTSPDHARNYFLRAVRNLALRSGRKATREERLEGEVPAPNGDDPARRALLARQQALGRLLLELDGPGRELIVRRYLEHQTLARIAAETGVPISTLHDREKGLLSELHRKLATIDGEAFE